MKTITLRWKLPPELRFTPTAEIISPGARLRIGSTVVGRVRSIARVVDGGVGGEEIVLTMTLTSGEIEFLDNEAYSL